MELKRFVNKYSKDKLVRKSLVHQTTWDRYKGLNQQAVKDDEIDFDFKNFKDACLNTQKSVTSSGPEILKSLRMLKRNLLLHFDMERTVNAR